MFQHLNENGGLTIILVTHDINVTNHAKRTIRIRDGLIESGGYGIEHPLNAPAVAGGVS
jgi:ABC-type lipoprotein export system ATPase subunit